MFNVVYLDITLKIYEDTSTRQLLMYSVLTQEKLDSLKYLNGCQLRYPTLAQSGTYLIQDRTELRLIWV